ncbi:MULTISPECIES: hypothetical protein [Aphanizomenon]|jgi:hypothetical protein|uniref:hypothetical protein n=1 Tax=Aphanizomenon TaxID=1175 RepID=UPI0036F246F6
MFSGKRCKRSSTYLIIRGSIFCIKIFSVGTVISKSNGSFHNLKIGLHKSSTNIEGRHSSWLRWCYEDGTILATGDERAQLLAERLKALGVDPDSI